MMTKLPVKEPILPLGYLGLSVVLESAWTHQTSICRAKRLSMTLQLLHIYNRKKGNTTFKNKTGN